MGLGQAGLGHENATVLNELPRARSYAKLCTGTVSFNHHCVCSGQAFTPEPRKVLRKYCDPLVTSAMGEAIGMSRLHFSSCLSAVGNL